MIMQTMAGERLKKTKLLFDSVAWFKALNPSVRKQILDMIRDDQLTAKGEDEDGDVIGLYSRATELFSGGRKQEGDPFDLNDTGAFYRSMFIQVLLDGFIVDGDTDKMKIKLSGKKLKQMDADGLINGFEFCYDEDIESLTFDDVIYLATTDGVNIVNPSSRIESLKYPLSNIKAQYHKRNVLLENIGAIGILSAKNSDMGGAIPMTAEEKKEIQSSWYRRSKDEILITESDVSWNAMSYPTKDLMLFEELNADKIAIIDAYGLNSYLFSNEKGSTFTNVKEGVRMAYQDTIIPETQQMYDAIAQQIGLKDEGITLIADFSHIPSLQSDENLKAQSMKIKAEAIEKIIQAGVALNEEEIREISGLNDLLE